MFRYKLVVSNDCPHCARVISLLLRTSIGSKVLISSVFSQSSLQAEAPGYSEAGVPILYDMEKKKYIKNLASKTDSQLISFFETLIGGKS
jgi:glutathionyl-hydroquinone reductase